MAKIPLKEITFPGLDNTYTIPEIDNTLSTAGKAADAKKTGDKISELKEDLNATNTELADIRVGADGTTYASAGAAVRGQITDLKNTLSDVSSDLASVRTGKLTIASNDIIQGSYSATGAVVANSARIRNNGFLRVYAGETLHFKPGTVVSQFLYGTFTSEKVFVEDSSWIQTESDIFVANDGYIITTFANSGKTDIAPSEYDATFEIVSGLKKTIENVFSAKNLIGLDSTIYYPVNVPTGSTLTMSTKDGNALGQSELNLTFYDDNKIDISSGGWNFNPTMSKRTIKVVNGGQTAKYVKWSRNPAKEVQLEFGPNATNYVDYSAPINNAEFVGKLFSEDETSKHTFISDYCAADVSDDVNAYNAKLLNTNGDTEQFLFYTDPHLAYQTGNVEGMLPRTYDDINYIQKIYNSLPFSFFLCGGDWLGNGDVPLTAMSKLTYIDGFMRKKFKNYLPVLGNHDTNYQGRETEESERYTGKIDNALIKNCFQRFRDEQRMYYKYVAPTSTWYIFDTGIEDEVISSYQNEQIDWFADALLTDNSKHIVISMHILYPGTIASGVIEPLTDKIFLVAQAYNARGSIANNGRTYDYFNATGTVSFCIAGHTHRDVTGVLHDIPFVVSMDGTAQGAQEMGSSNDRLCTFDMCIADWNAKELTLKRVGYGSDRVITIL